MSGWNSGKPPTFSKLREVQGEVAKIVQQAIESDLERIRKIVDVLKRTQEARSALAENNPSNPHP